MLKKLTLLVALLILVTTLACGQETTPATAPEAAPAAETAPPPVSPTAEQPAATAQDIPAQPATGQNEQPQTTASNQTAMTEPQGSAPTDVIPAPEQPSSGEQTTASPASPAQQDQSGTAPQAPTTAGQLAEAPAPEPEADPPILSITHQRGCILHPTGEAQCWGKTIGPETFELPNETFISISTYNSRLSDDTCGVTTNNRLLCWGNGLATDDMPADGAFTQVSLAEGYGCALTTEGTARCWGDNELGQASAPEGTFSAIAAGKEQACAISASGQPVCWGWDNFGKGAPPENINLTAITADDLVHCGLKAEGRPVCWSSAENTTAEWLEENFMPLDNLTYKTISVGQGIACGINTQPQAACWGPWTLPQRDEPPPLRQPQDPQDVVTIAAPGTSICSVNKAGDIRCWSPMVNSGRNRISNPKSLENITPGDPFIHLSSSADCGLKADGKAYCLPSTRQPSKIIPNVFETEAGLVDIAASEAFNSYCGLTTQGQALCWWWEDFGGLTRQNKKIDPKPVPLDIKAAFTALAMGPDHYICGITTGQEIRCLVDEHHSDPGEKFLSVEMAEGIGAGYQCGLTTTNAIKCSGPGTTFWPTHPTDQVKFTDLDLHREHVCAIRADTSKLMCWENGADITTVQDRAELPQDSFTKISVGRHTLCGITTEKNIVCSRLDHRTDLEAPALPPGNFTHIEYGEHYCGIREDGALLCWNSRTDPQKHWWYSVVWPPR